MLRRIALLWLLSCGAALALEAELVVPTRTIYPGETISAQAVGMRLFDVREGAPSSYARLPDTLDGKVAKRTLLAFQPVPLSAIEEPRVALIGRQVRVDFREGGLAISTFGSVLQSGGVGDVIGVRILDGGRTIYGAVQKDGSVRVGEGGT